MILVLQTNVAGQISVWLVEKKKIIYTQSLVVAWHGSDRALSFVDQILQRKKKTLQNLQKISVARGPGSFTAVRTGLIIANTLGTLLDIPVAGFVSKHHLPESDVLRYTKMPGQRGIIVKPWYGKSPNITRSKPKKVQARAKR